MYISRRERFSAAHKLWNYEFSDEKNIEIYDKCANANFHGHNYELIVTLRGEIDKSTGYVFDLKKLSEILNQRVINKLDHKNLNLDVDFLKDLIPTAENIAFAIWNEIEAELKTANCQLHKIKLIETENNFVEYYGQMQS